MAPAKKIYEIVDVTQADGKIRESKLLRVRQTAQAVRVCNFYVDIRQAG